ncbi:hypothetical protein [Paenibacillus aquistagni]|uniref:Uncharacterized protein n=2 Tax=Paenibacillus aquistagni TaxID=1852522 RepID=A0A1X7L9I9_9BACL|nr:hypothetical protein [Paenibacillus aquistagni]NMM53154.1 hypothetical protein [Paenibacillus aquistagni]SMG50508.1 hypothetical protein SAMN06295960_3128 [Paenibacillus aquistagni]
MIIEMDYSLHSQYMRVKDGVILDMRKLQHEFDIFIKSLKGNNYFQEYHLFKEDGGMRGFYVNVFGAEEFAAWINVEKYKEQVIWVIPKPDTEPDLVIHF